MSIISGSVSIGDDECAEDPRGISRPASTSPGLTRLLASRWSPRSYDESHSVSKADLDVLMEAGRWAPSSRNTQARRFIVGRRGGELFGRISETLSDNNALWAPRASILLVGVLLREDDRGRAEPYAEYDLGQAMAHIGVQAEAMGLRLRQIGGFDQARLAQALGLVPPHEPFIVAAIGRQGDAGQLTDFLAARERAPRTRRTLEELVIACD